MAEKKVLFIVYRTEWWGCFDGYCRQECRREDTICYVMPIPRYERDDITYKANFGKVHFHPEKLAPVLPEGAQMVDWQNFSLEQGFERIYIHNPYENGSLADTVELKYYASSLKQHTKKLIYVSHFMELLPDDYANCKAYDYVDAIYVPHESSRFSLDVKYDGKVEVAESGLPAYLDHLAGRLAGSDKNGKGQDSSGKLKLLYCVSYNDLYYGTEKQLRKMREIFDYVKKIPDIQLIFRPDEDIRARRQTLEEKIWKGYEQLVSDFRKNRIGIYDESGELYEAAVKADGIMSRNHPMNLLFSLQGKYVLQVDFVQRQGQTLPTREERCTPAIWDAAVTEEDGEIELLFVPSGTRLICRMVIPEPGTGMQARMDMQAAGGKNARVIAESAGGMSAAKVIAGAVGSTVKTAATSARGVSAAKGKTASGKKKGKKHLSGPKVEVLAEVPDEIAGGLNYMFVKRLGNCLYLIPCASDGIWKYNMETGYFGKTYLPNAVAGPVSGAFFHGKYLYMAPSVYPGVIKYDTETEEITVIDGWVRKMESMVAAEYIKEPYFSWSVVQEGRMLYMASSQGDIWMEFDMETDTWQLKSMNLSGMRFVHMAKDGGWVWLLPYLGDEVVLWNCASGEGRVVYVAENPNRESRLAPYLFAVDLGEAVAAFPQRETDHVLVIPKEAGVETARRLMISREASAEVIRWETEPAAGGLEIKEAGTGADHREERMAVSLKEAAKAVMEGQDSAAPLLGEGQIRKVTQGIPCGLRDCPSEYRKKLGCGYEFVKQLDSGLILTYEYYEGTFLLLDRKLNLLRRVPCRLDIEVVRRQQDVIWRNAQVRYGYTGRISEGSSIPVMMENFLRHGKEDRERIRGYYQRYYSMKTDI